MRVLKLNIFFFVFIGHLNVPSIRLKIDSYSLPESLIFSGECVVQHPGDIVVPDLY